MKPILRLPVFMVSIGLLFYVSCKKEYSCEGCRETNKPPIANAGVDTITILPVDSSKLDGSTSADPDGTITSFLWTKISGPASFDIVTPNDSITKIKNLFPGTYRFELTITDNGGLSSRDTIQIIVSSVVSQKCYQLTPFGHRHC